MLGVLNINLVGVAVADPLAVILAIPLAKNVTVTLIVASDDLEALVSEEATLSEGFKDK